MKLFIAITLITSLQLSAKTYSQQRITLKVQSTELKSALKQIERKSEFRFLYNNDLLTSNQKVSINANNMLVTDILTDIFKATPLSYRVLDNNLIVITPIKQVTQDIKVSGKVTGTNGEALASVSIQIKGSKVGTSTNASGTYSISVPEGATLIYSYVGYDPIEEQVGKRTEINVSLKPDTKALDEVVVIGYGTANKRDLTGSITKVSGKEVEDKPNTNPVASLQGKVAGLSVVNNGTPGAAPDIRIRGTVSIGNVHPLYVVDGIFNDNIDYINPSDIESIEILKDPSSLAIFGVKGATGVIAITTKKAKSGQILVTYNASYGSKKLVDKIKLANADQFKTLFAEENANNGITTPYDYTGLTANTDWIDAVTRRAQFSTNNLSVSANTDKNSFHFGLGYTSDEGIIKNERLQKLLFSLNDELKVTKGIKLGVNLNYSRTNAPYNASGVLDNARKVVPMVSAGTKNFRVKNPYGSDSINTDIYSGLNVGLQSSGVVNPLLYVENEWDKTITLENRTIGSVYTDINFLKNFNFRATWYADMSNVSSRQYVPLYYAYNPVNNTPYLYNQSTSVSESNTDYRKFQQDYILNYKKSFGSHSLTATGGFTTYYFGSFGRYGKSSQSLTGSPIPNDPRFWYLTNGFEDPTSTQSSSSQSEYATVSYLARILYNYRSKYFLTASFRNDASSRIPAANRNQQFWAVGAAWDISKESFMANQKIFNYLKLKGSVGVLGNQTASQLDGTPIDYPAYPNLLTGNNAVFGTNVRSSASQAYIENPNLKWETVSAQEIGVELNAFKNRLHFEANYFSKTTNNLLTYVSRASIGLKDELINGGSIRNWGEEFSASWNQTFTKDLSLSIAGNITFLKNKVLSLSADLPTGVLSRNFQNNGTAESRTEPGKPIGYFYGYVQSGIFQSYADILKSPVQSALGAYRPGDIKYKDVNGDGVITPDDRTLIGNPTPKFTYGTSITVNYKHFSLGVDVGGVYGNQIFRTWGALESPFQRTNYGADKINRWHGAGTSNFVPILSQADRINYLGSTYSIEDGSYFRIRNIQLGYSLNPQLLSKINLKSLRVFVNVQNLKTWKNNSGYTPEFGGDATAFGYDNAGGAIPMISTVGLNVTF
ncbi:TonB-dependent receptor [Parasediminibacterium paludis]|uniref:TonB-dependent receptor n=1 Tax=Parasediminibacterium paludis TaxID=908966 RepID=A0ABV8PVE2_9BACT